MQRQPILAAVDLGSNSFRLQVARVEGDQLYMLDGLREPVRLAAGLTAEKHLDAASQQRALAALTKFAERLRGLPQTAVRAVATNTLRVAKNAADFLPQAERVLGYPIEIIAGIEEARLIYLGVAHSLPPSPDNRLVIDIGGGSTELIIGNGLAPLQLESLYMGSVSYTLRFFPDGMITKKSLHQAEIAARNEIQSIAADFRGKWKDAIGSSGTARILNEMLAQGGYSNQGLTRDGLERLRADLIKAGDAKKLALPGLRADRIPALPGGFAIMHAAFCELDIEHMEAASSALREGVLYDLLGRFHDNDMREITVQRFMERYRVAPQQADRVSRFARMLAAQFLDGVQNEAALQMLDWTARLHEIGISVAHAGYHKHTAYILANADMPGFSKKEQARMSLLALAQRGNLAKVAELAKTPVDCALAMSLRLSVLFHRNRSASDLPEVAARFSGAKFHLLLPAAWLERNTLAETALREEMKQWKAVGLSLQVVAE